MLSADDDEIAKLDRHTDWVRTGETLGTVLGNMHGTPVCRFYLPPGLGDSHLMMGDPDECAETAVRFPAFILETPELFRDDLPERQTGACAAGEVPVYRLWNGRLDSNHRYTASRAIRDTMVASGFIAEGYGPDATSLCAPVPAVSTLP